MKNDEAKECCCDLSAEEKANDVRMQCPNILDKYNPDPIAFYDSARKVVKMILNMKIDGLSMLAIIGLLNNGDIDGPLTKVATSKVILKLSKNGEIGLFTFINFNRFQFVVGYIPDEQVGKVRVGNIISHWYRGSYFGTIDVALKAFNQLTETAEMK